MKNKKEPITQKLYSLIPSQQTMYLMVKYSLHKQLVQIPISVSVEKDLDFGVLKQAWNIEIERNDSLRLRYVIVNKEIKQYFLDRYTMNYIQIKRFKSLEEQEEFFSKDAQKPIGFLKED